MDHIEGSGLGMAITGMIVANMGGSIRVESEPGMGSIFTVELDFCRAEPEMDSESEGISDIFGKVPSGRSRPGDM